MMRSALLVACFALMLPGCFISRTKEKEVSTSHPSRACGSHTCAADEDCVQSPSGTFHCE
jgi:hypothetical protein